MSVDWRSLAEELVGRVPDEELYSAESNLLGEEVERCSECDWWFDLTEMTDDGTCDSCRVEDEE